MQKNCEICGCRLITGRKYCWRHKHEGELNEEQIKNKIIKRNVKELGGLVDDGFNRGVRFVFQKEIFFFIIAFISFFIGGFWGWAIGIICILYAFYNGYKSAVKR